MIFRRVEASEFDWEGARRAEGATFAHTPGWVRYASGNSSGEPVFAVLESEGSVVGYFIGSMRKKYGVKVLASPGLGWTTPYVGIALADTCDRVEVLEALLEFAFGECGCSHLEIADPVFDAVDGARCGFEVSYEVHHVTDLSGSPQDLQRRLSNSVRRYARHAVRNGLVVEEGNPEGFAEEFSRQAEDVFKRQGLTPPVNYTSESVQRLIEACFDTGELLLLRVRDSSGECLATAASIGSKHLAYGWGAASLSESWELRPNELLLSHELKAWQERGATEFDWGPMWNYKVKYGAVTVPRWRLHRSKRPLLRIGREFARMARDLRVIRRFGVGAQGPASRWERS